MVNLTLASVLNNEIHSTTDLLVVGRIIRQSTKTRLSFLETKPSKIHEYTPSSSVLKLCLVVVVACDDTTVNNILVGPVSHEGRW